jgi:hypothetical protein
LSLVSSAWAIETSVGTIDIRSTTRYQFQWSEPPNGRLVSGNSSDQDISEILGVDWNSSNIDGLSFSFLGKYAKDLDNTPSGSIFQDALDATGGQQRQRFDAYYAFAEKKDIVPGIDFRLGRQYVYGAESVHFDGVWVKADRSLNDRFSLEAFGGQIVQMYSNLTQDGVGGLNLGFYPSRELTVYLNSVFYRENSYEASVYWRPLEYLKANARWALIDDKNREASIDLIGDIEATGTTIGFNAYHRFRVTLPDDFIYDYTYSISDSLNNIRRLYLAREGAYTQYTLSISQPIPTQKGLAVFVRGAKRDLAHDNQEDLYNTSFYSLTCGVSIDEWLGLHGFHMSTGVTSWWEKRDYLYEGKSRSVFIDLRQELPHKIELGGGFYYKDEDVNSLIEGEAAAHYYGSLRYGFAKDKWAELKYEYEHDDYYREFGVGDINAITATVSTRF